ncbi:MAG: dihydropteroate synthase [Deltaproteobacteria bacterium]|nr:dihydropteroate synthase [Deltaproteobacteria bacterium]
MTSPKIMGILNCTPDSFLDGGKYSGVSALADRAFQMENEGADIIDIGGESTRPGAAPVEIDEELRRTIPVIEAIRKRSGAAGIPISIDTTKARVAMEAVTAGATMINDVSGFRADPEMAVVAAEMKVPVVLMHSRGTPQTMQTMTDYRNVVDDVMAELKQSVDRAHKAGLKKDQILIDPGFGFAKTFEQNIEMLRNLKRFREMGYPIMIGLSRKNFVGIMTGEEKASGRLAGSLALAFYAAMQGIDILRVHDVAETRDVVLAFRRLFN